MLEPTPEQKAAVLEAVKVDPGVYTMSLAQSLYISEAAVVWALPRRFATPVPVCRFDWIWEEMTQWEKVTFVVSSPGMIGEISGRLPKGTYGHDMFNIHAPSCPLGGHFRIGMLDSIWLLDKPFMGHDAKGVFFFDMNGDRMCAVYVGRDEQHQLIPSVLYGFKQIWDRFSTADELPA